MKNWFIHLFSHIVDIFESPRAKAVEAQLAELTRKALPIVEEIGKLVPNRTVQQVVGAYEKYGIPLADTEIENPTHMGNALLNLATVILQKNHAPTAAISILNTAVQLAVVASNLKGEGGHLES